MIVAVVHHQVSAGAPADEQDVAVQAESVRRALDRLGHRVYMRQCGLDLETIRRELIFLKPDVIFNLVETLAGTGRLIHLFPAMLDAEGLRYTGSGSLQILATSNKTVAKRLLTAAGIATPEWIGPFPADLSTTGCLMENSKDRPGDADRWIMKSVWEHASVGLDDDSVVTASGGDVRRMLPARAPGLGGACFAERYVDGREFNLSLLSGTDGPQVLPPAEIVFFGFPEGKPRIVDYQAKWDESSAGWSATPRRFDFEEPDRIMLKRLEETARRCWRIFNLKGYARVDFRVDAAGVPWVLEVNANPCLSPDLRPPSKGPRYLLKTPSKESLPMHLKDKPDVPYPPHI